MSGQLPTAQAMLALCSLSPQPRALGSHQALGPVIDGATASSKKCGGEPEIIDFVLPFFFEGNRTVSGKGIKTRHTS